MGSSFLTLSRHMTPTKDLITTNPAANYQTFLQRGGQIILTSLICVFLKSVPPQYHTKHVLIHRDPIATTGTLNNQAEPHTCQTSKYEQSQHHTFLQSHKCSKYPFTYHVSMKTAVNDSFLYIIHPTSLLCVIEVNHYNNHHCTKATELRLFPTITLVQLFTLVTVCPDAKAFTKSQLIF